MYRSLSDHGSLTEYVYVLPLLTADRRIVLIQPPTSLRCISFPPWFRSSDPRQFSSKASNHAVQCRGANIPGAMHFASATLSEGTGTTYESPVFLPADPIHMEFVRGGSISSLPRVITKEKVTDNQVACESESV